MVEMFNALVEVLEGLIAKIMEFVNALKGASADEMPWEGWTEPATDAE